jgi:hypothetical protein
MNARFLSLSIAITLLLLLLPFAQAVTYPFLIFSTFIHEISHAIAAIITGGHVDSLVVRMNGSGVTYTHGGSGLLISSAGYIGTSLFGGILLILSRRNIAHKVLYACSVLICLATAAFAGHSNNFVVVALLACSLLLAAKFRDEQRFSTDFKLPLLSVLPLVLLVLYLFATDSLFSWIAGIVLAVALFCVARLANTKVAHFFLTFLAVQCSLNALDAIKTVYFLSLRSTCINDAATLASMTGVPAAIWAALWFVLSMFILFISAVLYLKRSQSSL